MRLPSQLSRNKPKVHKNTFGHVLIISGSKGMLGAAALTSLGALRAGAGLVTVGTPKSLNKVVQRKISSAVMTLPLAETKEQTISISAYSQIQKKLESCDCIAIGPGLSQNKSTQKLILKIIRKTEKPIVIDADALNALSNKYNILKNRKGIKILTPHPGEISRLLGIKKEFIEKNRIGVTKKYAKAFNCTILLKGHRTVVASSKGKTYINKTGNPGMATAGSGDVLTGIISAFLAQGLPDFDAAKYGVFIHGKAGDLAAKKRTKVSMIATDIIEQIPNAFRSLK